MERERRKSKEIAKEIRESTEKEIEVLKKELERLKELKRQKELKKKEIDKSDQESTTIKTEIKTESEEKYQDKLIDIETRLNDIDKYLLKQFEAMDKNTYIENTTYIEGQLQKLEEEIVGEKGLIEKELSPYEKLLEYYPWINEPKYAFMYVIPNKKKNPSDYQSWRTEWSKVLFDYTKYAVLHIIYLRQLYTELPFSKFEDRQKAIREITQELIEQKLAKFISKDENQLRIYWKSLDLWAEDIYNWALDNGKLEPILIYELRESKQEFSNLPKIDLEEVFKILTKIDKGHVIKLEDGQIALKIKLE